MKFFRNIIFSATQQDCKDYCRVESCPDGGEVWKEPNGAARACTTNRQCPSTHYCTPVDLKLIKLYTTFRLLFLAVIFRSQLGPALSTKLNLCAVRLKTLSARSQETSVFDAQAHPLLATTLMLTLNHVPILHTMVVKVSCKSREFLMAFYNLVLLKWLS